MEHYKYFRNTIIFFNRVYNFRRALKQQQCTDKFVSSFGDEAYCLLLMVFRLQSWQKFY